jgi:hypothetical protein
MNLVGAALLISTLATRAPDPAEAYVTFCREREIAEQIQPDGPGGDWYLECLFGPIGQARRCARELKIAPRTLAYLRLHRECFQIEGASWEGFGLQAGRCHLAALHKSPQGGRYAALIDERLAMDDLSRQLADCRYARAAEEAEKKGAPLQWGGVRCTGATPAMFLDAVRKHLVSLRESLQQERSKAARSCMERERKRLEEFLKVSEQSPAP